MIKKLIRIPLRGMRYLLTSLIMYVGWLFVSKGTAEPDNTTKTARKRIFDLSIDYWEEQLGNLNVKDKGIDVLEVGSGIGQWLIAFTRFANRVEGVEPGEEILSYSKEKIKEFDLESRINVQQAFAEELPYEDNSFDVVFCAGVFMFTKQDKALKEFKRVLKSNGKVLITVNGLGYFIMYLLNGMRYLSIEKTKYGLSGIFNTLFKWVFKRQIGTCAVSYNEMKEMLEKEGFKLNDTRIWLPLNLYSCEHLAFVTNYAFLAEKK